MRLHINIVTLIGGFLIGCVGLGGIGPLVGIAVVGSELYRCRRIALLTSDISADTILDFYRGDRARRYFGAKSTAIEIRKFAATFQTNNTEAVSAPSDA
ncbi:hypothetical protein [Crateriforma conspicua]|uniref:Uncharacterized protein n=1 Tax=Crateriforma conspicua TaxID=2527996 RepID=A0A5C5YB64_9PLAN|nr:hypothetical protein [Crateriforma conspicua]TWT72620.1 hypothetical protein Pan14r_49400 [Crateriforma conspicua]